MKKIIQILFFSFALCIYSTKAQEYDLDSITNIHELTDKATKGSWRTVKNEKGITIAYRALKLKPSVKTRELKAHFTIHGNKDSAFAYLYYPEKYKEWNKGSKSYTILEGDSLQWVSHIVYDIPFPFSQQDLVTQNTKVDSNHQITINTISKPNYIPSLEDVDRIKYYIAEWVLNQKENNTVDVTFSAITMSKSYIPRFIKDPIVQNNLIKSFSILKERLKGN